MNINEIVETTKKYEKLKEAIRLMKICLKDLERTSVEILVRYNTDSGINYEDSFPGGFVTIIKKEAVKYYIKLQNELHKMNGEPLEILTNIYDEDILIQAEEMRNIEGAYREKFDEGGSLGTSDIAEKIINVIKTIA